MTQTPSLDTPRRCSLMPHLACGDAARAIDFYCAAFGHLWSVTTHLRDVSAEEMADAVKALC
ncbi:MAG: hypothetical protein ACYCXT_13530 [Acidiferrobacteraceae bacterium]